MSRLDDHVAAVQNRLAMRIFLMALAWNAAVLFGLILLAVLIDRIFLVRPPQATLWMYGGAAAAILGAIVYAWNHRPDPREAAIPIDEKLGLKEKISTALYMRTNSDPFAQAAVLDAEESARQVVLKMGEHFPLSFPRPAYFAIGLAVAAMLAYWLIDPMNLFNRRQRALVAEISAQKVEQARKNIQANLARIEAQPKIEGSEEALKLAQAQLQAALNQAQTDPEKANRTAARAWDDVNNTLQQIKSSAKYAQAQNEMKMMRSMQKPQEGQGPVADAHRAIADGKFSEAIDELNKVAENFDKMDKADQQKAAEQMQQLAQQLAQQATNPQQQQKMQQQMQQMGMNQQQAQQAQQLMQQAAQGDKQAMQQLQQMQQQVQQQMNNGQGPNPQQQQQMQQMMQQMQAQMNAQQQAQQMSQAAQQMAQAMQQAQQQQQNNQAQPSQQTGQAQNQQMSQGMKAMQQQMQQMQAAAQDAQQIAAAQNAAAAAQASAQNAMNGNGNGGGQQGNGTGMWNPNGNIAGNNPQKFAGQNGFAGANQGGQGAGDRTYKNQAPFSVKQEIDPSQEDEKGRILASNFIKDNNPNRGNSTETLKQVADRAVNEQTDEIDQERISRQAAQSVKQYFGSMSSDGQ